MPLALPLIALAAFVAAHVFIGRLTVLDATPRSRWLSLAGGASVSYVFLHLLPELERGQRVLAQTGVLAFLEHHVWLIALAGLVVFYGLERLAVGSRVSQSPNRPRPASTSDESTASAATPPGVFWVHIGSFAIYNMVIGFLLLHEPEQMPARDLAQRGYESLALLLHIVVVDHGLRAHHRHRYDRLGRWLLSAAVLAGAVLGQGARVEDAEVVVLVAFIAGGVVLNVMKEELPEERESRFSFFLLGAVAYSLLLLAAA